MEPQPEPHDEAPAFPLFQSLPTEIRLQIWASAAQQPRMVVFEAERSGCPQSSRQPAMLHACHESRATGLKAYAILHDFGQVPTASDFRKRRARLLYFNAGCDTLFLDSWPRSGWGRKGGLHHGGEVAIERLAVTSHLWSCTNRWVIWRDLRLLRGLQGLILVADDWESDAENKFPIEDVNRQDTVKWNFGSGDILISASLLKSAIARQMEKMVVDDAMWKPEIRVTRFVR
jgi:hypothetical protein